MKAENQLISPASGHFEGLGDPCAPKTFQNRAKMVPTCDQGAEKSKQWLLSTSWGRLGQFLIDFRGQQGPKLAFKIEPWGVSWDLLGRLGASWRRPGLDFLAN